MHKYKLGIVELQYISLVILILSTLVKAFFYIKIKSKKKKQLSSFINSFRTWYLAHNFHDSDTNPSRQFFFHVSNYTNIPWYISLVVFIVTMIMGN